PGVAVGVVVDGDLVWFKGYGSPDVARRQQVTADTVYRIGSITKTFTGLALLELRDEGKLSLEDPITRFLPEASGLLYPTRYSAPIRIRNLITHTAGLPRDAKISFGGDHDPGESEFLDKLAGVELGYPPGGGGSYSNLGAALSGLVVARASHQRYDEF